MPSELPGAIETAIAGFDLPQEQAYSAATRNAGADSFALENILKLTRALRSGDEQAFAWLYQHWNSRIQRYCFALAAGDADRASEISQAVWLRVVKHIRPLADERALWNWLACAARHAAIDQSRVRSRYQNALLRFCEWWKQLSGPESFKSETSDLDEVLFAALGKALSQLDTLDRSLIEDRYFNGYALDEIGARHSLSRRAVEGRLARLRLRLRESISNALKHNPDPS